jgi:hypothetical protein
VTGRALGVVAAAALVAGACGAWLTACFEPGPLGPSADPGGADPGWLQDPGAPTDPGHGAPDPGPADPGARDLGGPDAGLPCLVDGDCAALQTTDLCAGLVRCIDNACQSDPATVVTCPPTGDACVVSECVPTTGLCTSTTVCGCEPMGQLSCFTPKTLSTADPGDTNVMGGYPCGPAGGDGPEHTWTFSVPETTQVRINAASSASTLVWVLGYNGTSCVKESCVAGGINGVNFEAIGGFKYAVILEHPAGAPASVTLTPLCGVQVESVCDDGIDDDNNGLTDCDDGACLGQGGCPSGTETVCTDDLDDDADGQTDCEDSDCAAVLVCLQPCEAVLTVGCGFNQGLGTGGGKSQATDYSCGPAAGGKEVVYRFTSNQVATVTATVQPAVPGIAVYVMQETGKGCTPSDCIAYSPTAASWSNAPGTTYYVSVDAPAGVEGGYGLSITCQ